MPDASPRFVLVGTSHAGNVGSAARALKVMGFSDLVLVAPRDPRVRGRAEAIALASGATDVLAGARVVASLAEALDGIGWVGATAMTPRDFGPPNLAPREAFARLAGGDDRVAFVFGSERHGLSNDDVYACHACLTIPVDPGYGSLNLAQAVQLVAYDWRQAIGGFSAAASGLEGADGPPAAAHVPRGTPIEARADAVAVRGLVEHWREALVSLGFLDPAAPKKLVPRLLRLANRARLTEEEIHILRGIARAIEARAAGEPRR